MFWARKSYTVKHGAGKCGDGLQLAQSTLPCGFLGKFAGDDVYPPIALESNVLLARAVGHGHGGRQRPRGGGPDDGRDFLPRQRRIDCSGVAGQSIANPDARADVVGVFDFGFGQSGFIVNAPVNRLQTFVDHVVFKEGVEVLDRPRLVLRVHGHVRFFEAAEDTDALELFALQVEVFLGIFPARLADLQRVHLQLLASERFVDFNFDRQAVTVPSGHIRSVKTRHIVRFDDEILQALVERVAQMDGSVGVRRAVVQDVNGRAMPCLANFFIDMDLLPMGEHFRLVLRQVGLHRELGFWQVKCRFEI